MSKTEIPLQNSRLLKLQCFCFSFIIWSFVCFVHRCMFRFLKILAALFSYSCGLPRFLVWRVYHFFRFFYLNSRVPGVWLLWSFFSLFRHGIWIVQHPSNLNRIIWVATCDYYATKLLIQKHAFFVLQWYTLHYFKRKYTQHFHVHFFCLLFVGLFNFLFESRERENEPSSTAENCNLESYNQNGNIADFVVFFVPLSIPTSIFHLERIQIPFSCKNWANSIKCSVATFKSMKFSVDMHQL